MNEGQSRQGDNETSLFIYSNTGNKAECQRVWFSRNPKPPLYQSRIAKMKENFRAPINYKRTVRRTKPIPKTIKWSIESEKQGKAAPTLRNDITHSTGKSSIDDFVFPDDLELNFTSGQLDISKQSNTSTVPDIENGQSSENTEPQEFYQMFTPEFKPRKRTYRDFPNYTNKKPYYSSSSS